MKRHQSQNLEINFFGCFFWTFWALGKFMWYLVSWNLAFDAWGAVLEIEAVKLSKKVIWMLWSGTKYQNLEIKIFGRFFLQFLGPG